MTINDFVNRDYMYFSTSSCYREAVFTVKWNNKLLMFNFVSVHT